VPGEILGTVWHALIKMLDGFGSEPFVDRGMQDRIGIDLRARDVCSSGDMNPARNLRIGRTVFAVVWR